MRSSLAGFIFIAGVSGCSLLVDTDPYKGGGLDGGSAHCGNGVVEPGEQCDDGNDTSGDGCEPRTCTFTCERAADCGDANPCNGAELCDVQTHTCRAGTPPDPGAPCPRDGQPDGVCRAGEPPSCVDVGCGNGIIDGEEECDDGNDVGGDGCENGCTFSCTDDSQCDDRDPCNGRERCNLDEHVCVMGTPLDCDDGSPCTADSCDRLGCRNELIDHDGDGQASTELGPCGTDCDDSDPFIYLGAEERCEEEPLVDNNCNGTTADNPDSSTWYSDCDGDGYAPLEAVSRTSCTEPALEGGCGWTARAPVDALSSDCDDARSDVSPIQRMYFTEPLVRSGANDDERFGNYDCDGTAQYQHARRTVDATPTCTPGSNIFGGLICKSSNAGGWVGTAPACGEEGTLTGCTGLSTCTGDECASRTDCKRFCLRPFGGSCSASCTGDGCRYEYRCCSSTSARVIESCR